MAGEVLAGVVLGPTVLRQLFPGLQVLFPAHGNNHLMLTALGTLGITMFLLVAGLEVDLKLVDRQKKVSLAVSLGGIAFPFAIGFIPAYLWSERLGSHASTAPIIFALFFGAALSITSLPILAKNLKDLALYRSPFGMLVISAAVVDDVVGWSMPESYFLSTH